MYLKSSKSINTKSLLEMKVKGEKISMLTAYDFSTARLLTKAGIEILLVGDSASNVVAGYSTTLPITLDEMIFLAKSVRRGRDAEKGKCMIVFDMPFLSYHVSTSDAIANIGKVIKETECEAIKIEGGLWACDLIKRITEIGIPVMGHIGLMPQSVNQYGGFRLQGNDESNANRICEEAIALEKAGAFSIVLEKIPATLSKKISQKLHIPTIGIGAGIDCDGQVLVINDLVGLNESFKPKFVRQFAKLEPVILSAVEQYIKEVKEKTFPSAEESY